MLLGAIGPCTSDPLKDMACLRKDLHERTTEDFAQSDREAEANIDVGLRFDALDVLLADPDRVGQSALSHVGAVAVL